MKSSTFLASAVVIFSFSAVVTVVTAMSEPEIKDAMIAMSEGCKNETKASDEDVELMASKKFPATHEGKCMVLCVQKQFGIVSV